MKFLKVFLLQKVVLVFVLKKLDVFYLQHVKFLFKVSFGELQLAL